MLTHAEQAAAAVAARITADAAALQPVEQARAAVEALDRNATSARRRIGEIDRRLERGSSPDAAASAIAAGGDVLEAVGSPTALREERAALAAGLAQVEQRQRAARQAAEHATDRAATALGRDASPIVDALAVDLQSIGEQFVAVFAAAIALEQAANVPGAAALAKRVHRVIPELRAAGVIAAERAPVPPLVAAALGGVADRLRELGRVVPAEVLVPTTPPKHII